MCGRCQQCKHFAQSLADTLSHKRITDVSFPADFLVFVSFSVDRDSFVSDFVQFVVDLVPSSVDLVSSSVDLVSFFLNRQPDDT